MRNFCGFVVIVFCLSGCSEMKVIGNAALRELRTDAVSVNWDITVPAKMTPRSQALLQAEAARVKTFSSFRNNLTSTKIQARGLWEKHGG